MTRNQLNGLINQISSLEEAFESDNFIGYEFLTQKLARAVEMALIHADEMAHTLRNFGDLEDDYEESID